jgi:hypothetical protein
MENNVQFLRGVKSKYNSTETPNGIYFSTDTNAILMNGQEFGIYPQNFKFLTDGDKVELKTLCKDVDLKLNPYSVNTDIDFSGGDYLEIDIDLTNCQQGNNIELVSIGADISSWWTFGHTLRFFYSHNKEYQGNNNINMQHYVYDGSSDGMSSEIFSVGDTMTIKISSEGIFVDGKKRTTITASTISDILSLTNLNIGSARTDTAAGNCDATYTKIARYKTISGGTTYMSYMSDEFTTELKEIPVATQTSNGMMSIADKIKLDSISDVIDCGTYDIS